METLLNEKEQKELYPDSHTIGQGTPNNEPEPTFQDSLNNYEQLLINRKRSLKPKGYSLINEWNKRDLGGALNQNINQWFVDKWEGLGPDNQQLILDGIEIIKAAKVETKGNWTEYPVESTIWHTADFLGEILGPVYQFGTDSTAKLANRMLGINEDIVKKANVINQIRTGKVFPFLPTKIPQIPGVSTQILPVNKALPPATKVIKPVPGSNAKNITAQAIIEDIFNMDGPAFTQAKLAHETYATIAKTYKFLVEGVQRTAPSTIIPGLTENPASVYALASLYKGDTSGLSWNSFGYEGNQRPTLINKETTDANKELVALGNENTQGLYQFYEEVNKYVANNWNRIKDRRNPLELVNERANFRFTHPITGETFLPKIIKKKNFFGKVSSDPTKGYRISMESELGKFRRSLKDQFRSSWPQKYARTWKDKEISRMNKVEIDKYNKLYQFLSTKRDALTKQIESLSGKSTSMTFGSSEVAGLRDQREVLNERIDRLIHGVVYGEHGYAISNKIWKRLKDLALQSGVTYTPKFITGDAKNFHIVVEPDRNNRPIFDTKNAFDMVVESAKGQLEYPGIVINYNPNLHLTSDGNPIEGIIRIEDIDSISVGNDPRYPRVLSGKTILEYNVKVNGPLTQEGVRAFLARNGIHPQPVTTTPAPTEATEISPHPSTQDFNLQKFLSDVFDLRVDNPFNPRQQTMDLNVPTVPVNKNTKRGPYKKKDTNINQGELDI
tara:strand:+ start:1624 stop:3807 length:2184 start_codon:yes stop_codon:yes gene_type:complete